MRAPLGLLIASLCVIAMLVWQALAAEAGHRALADRVLRDYADLAATEFVRRGSTYVFTYGFDIAAQALAGSPTSATGQLPARAALGTMMPTQSQRAIELVGAIVRVDCDSGLVDTSGGAVAAAVQRQMIAAITQSAPSSAPSQVVIVTDQGRTRLFVFASDSRDAGMGRVRMGFEVRLDTIAAWLKEFVLREPLLPPALASREVAQSSLSIAVSAPDGTMLLPGDARRPGSTIVVARPWSDETSRRALPGFEVTSTIEVAAASNLIIGGVPRSRVLPLLALLALASAMAIAAVVQLRRERAVGLLRSDFVTRTSHELRTPVARIRMFTDTLLLDRVRSEQERREAVHAIDRAARRLSLLVENVLQFSRAGAGGLDVESTELSAFVRDVAAEFSTTVNPPLPISITVRQTVDVTIDRAAMQQALLNLLDNAWKYAGPGGTIALDLAIVDREVRICISDTGPGVPVADRTRVWDAYVRLERDRQSSVAGTGIGLAVVKDVIGSHRGRCWIETAPSGGAALVIALPLAAEAATTRPATA